VMDEKLEAKVQEIIGLICREELNLVPAAGAVMVFVPEAVHRGAKEAEPHHEGHHASYDGCKARLRPGPRRKMNQQVILFNIEALLPRNY
jgi:hypothetical protein